MSDRDPRIRALVEAARAAGPTAEDRARVRTALAARLAAAASSAALPAGKPAVGAPPAAAASPGALAAGAGAKLVVAGVLIGATGFGAGLFAGKASPPPERARYGVDVQALRRAHMAEHMGDRAPVAPAPKASPVDPPAPPAPTSVEGPTPIPVGSTSVGSTSVGSTSVGSTSVAPTPVAERERPPVPPGPSVPRRLPAPPAGAPAAAEAPAAGPVAAADPSEPASRKASSLVEETALLREAQTKLGAGDAAAALARLDELGARHPDGLLREERLAARIVALCAAGRVDEARRAAAQFLAEAPLSIHAARVRASCASGKGEQRP
jgi:hypothetical protein